MNLQMQLERIWYNVQIVMMFEMTFGLTEEAITNVVNKSFADVVVTEDYSLQNM